MIQEEKTVSILQQLLDQCASSQKTTSAQNHQPPDLNDTIRQVKQVVRKRRTNKEFCFPTVIGDYKMVNVILDLGSDVNILPVKTRDLMGRPLMEQSTIQLRLDNQENIYPLDKLEGFYVDIDGLRSNVDFEVIEIVDGTNPYLALLGIDWAFDNLAIINLKKRQITFEADGIKVVAPLDPRDGERYVEPVRPEFDAEELDNL